MKESHDDTELNTLQISNSDKTEKTSALVSYVSREYWAQNSK